MFVRPAPGLAIRDPDLKDLLPPEGREVSEEQPYWHRRLRDGDVILGSAPDTANRSASE
ncbi:MAG TPA: DUF2635 domain-containing protein [Patescibacteria group bacterium]|nr:DUF2635 domain-containing protein [Patescibacteria group bacterium]